MKPNTPHNINSQYFKGLCQDHIHFWKKRIWGWKFGWESTTLLRFFDIKLRGSVLSLSGIPVSKRKRLLRNNPEVLWNNVCSVCLCVLTVISSAAIHGSVRRGEKCGHTLPVFLQHAHKTSSWIHFHRWTAFTSRWKILSCTHSRLLYLGNAVNIQMCSFFFLHITMVMCYEVIHAACAEWDSQIPVWNLTWSSNTHVSHLHKMAEDDSFILCEWCLKHHTANYIFLNELLSRFYIRIEFLTQLICVSAANWFNSQRTHILILDELWVCIKVFGEIWNILKTK